MGEENLIKQLLPRLYKSDTGQTHIVLMSCVVDLRLRDNNPQAAGKIEKQDADLKTVKD